MSTQMLMLPPAPSEWKQNSNEISASLSGFPSKANIQPAGRTFHKFMLFRTLGIEQNENEEEDIDLEESTEEDTQNEANFAHKKKKIFGDSYEDLYALMGLENLRWRATPNQIKQAYHKAAIKMHPDKQKTKDEAAEELFKALQKAYETLSDPKKKKAYDSTEPFDDSVPSPLSSVDTTAIPIKGKGGAVSQEWKDYQQKFFDTFGPVFERNSKWCTTKAPSLGTKNTKISMVFAFYDFWRNAQSWRGFAHQDEYDPEEAESREERRWMERQNKKLQNENRKKEKQRINTLIENAYKSDPRILQNNAQQEYARELQRQQRLESKKQKQAARRELEQKEKEEEEKRKEAEKKELQRRKQEKDRVTKIIRKSRNTLRNLCKKRKEMNIGEAEKIFLPPEIELICRTGNEISLPALCETFKDNDPTVAEKAFQAEVSKIREEEAKQKEEMLRKKREKAAEQNAKKRPWTPDELSLLAKGLQKWPAGVPNRLQKVAEFIGTRDKQQVREKTLQIKSERPKELAAGAAEQKKEAFKRWQESKKQVDQKAIGGTSGRDDVIYHDVNFKSWSNKEQRLFETGVKEYTPGTIHRWEKIAARVPTRSPIECKTRYIFLVKYFKEKQQREQQINQAT